MRITDNIYLRLFLPFTASLLTAVVVAWWIATALLSNTLEHRLSNQLAHAAAVMAQGRFPFTEALLKDLAKLLRADIVLFDPKGQPTLSTLEEREPALMPLLSRQLGVWRQGARQAEYDTFRQADASYLLVLQPMQEGRDGRYATVGLLVTLADVRRSISQVAWALAGAALMGTLLLAWVGHRLARGITLPIRQLADMAAQIAAGNRTVRTPLRQANEIGVLADALNKLVERLESYEAEIAENSRLAAIGQTTARIAHEIRNPLTAIKLQVQLLHEAIAPDRQAITGSLLDEIRRLDLIVSSTLDLSRPVRLTCQPTDLNQLVTEVAQLVTAPFAHRGIRLELALPSQLPEIIVDAARIKQLLWNLLVNASDELPQGGIIRLSAVAQPGSVMLAIEDSGPGIPQDRRATLFTASASHKPGGLGLGLPLCREIAELHGGYIRLDDSELGGAKFCIFLPLTNQFENKKGQA